MTEYNKSTGSVEVSILDLVRSIIKQRKLILVFCLLSGTFGFLGQNAVDVNTSWVQVTAANIPPTVDDFNGSEVLKIWHRFDQQVHDKENFDAWLNENKSMLVSFEAFDRFEYVSGQRLLKDGFKPFVTIPIDIAPKQKVVIDTDNIKLIAELIDYLTFTNSQLTQRYLEQSKIELSLLSQNNQSFDTFSTRQDLVAHTFKHRVFKQAVESGDDIFLIGVPVLGQPILVTKIMVVFTSMVLSFCAISSAIILRNFNLR